MMKDEFTRRVSGWRKLQRQYYIIRYIPQPYRNESVSLIRLSFMLLCYIKGDHSTTVKFFVKSRVSSNDSLSVTPDELITI